MPAQFLPFLLFAIVLVIAPGPDFALGLRNSLRGGGNAMWWTGVGCCAGLLVHAVISLVGLSALLAASSVAYTALKTAGVAYLIWLGASTLWRTVRSPQDTAVDVEPLTPVSITRWAAFRQGMVSNLLNPKIILLFLTLMPQFISPGESRVTTSFVLTLVFVAVALTWWRLTSWLVGSLRRVLSQRRVRVTLERLSGGVLIALGVRIALDGS